METFAALLAICAGNSPVTGELPAQRPVTRSFDGFFDGRLRNGSHFAPEKMLWASQCYLYPPGLLLLIPGQSYNCSSEATLTIVGSIKSNRNWWYVPTNHYSDVIMGTMASQITSLTIVYSTVCSGEDQRKHQSSASLGFVRGIHRWPVNFPHKWPVTQKMFPFDDVIMRTNQYHVIFYGI